MTPYAFRVLQWPSSPSSPCPHSRPRPLPFRTLLEITFAVFHLAGLQVLHSFFLWCPAKCTPEYLASHYPISCPVPSTAYPTTNHIDTLSPLTWILRRWFISRVYVTSNPVCHPHDASHPSMVLSVVCYAVLILLVSKRADIRVIETAVVVAGSLSMPSMP